MRVEEGLEVRTRDGVTLRADAYLPDDEAPVPAVLNRTCYDRSFSMTPPAAIDPDLVVEAGFALVCQDVRGQFGSDGEFYPFASEAQDGADTIAWVAEQPWCDGRVVMAGRSYGGATQWLAAGEQPPALRAISPIVCGSSYYEGWVYQGGAFQLGFNLFWTQMMTASRDKKTLGDMYRFLPLTRAPILHDNPGARFYLDWLAHPTDDDFWRRAAIDGIQERVEVPALIVGGWYDTLLKGTLENFARMRGSAATEEARDRTRLLIGPWAHGSTYGAYPDHAFKEFGGADQISTGEAQLDYYRAVLDGTDTGASVRLFVMGADEWRDEQDWPPPGAGEQRWYLRADGILSPDAPGPEEPDAYEYDPADPAPTLGGPTSLPAAFMRTNSGPMDQSKTEERDDVLVYTSEPLERPMEVIGPVSAVLFAATSAADTDWVVKLCDVDPDGVSRILAEGILRARFRESLAAPRPVEPGEAHEYRIDLVATANVFAAGHRIRVAVTSASFPRFDRNLNTGNAPGADTHDDIVVADQRVFHDAPRPSHIRLPVVPS